MPRPPCVTGSERYAGIQVNSPQKPKRVERVHRRRDCAEAQRFWRQDAEDRSSRRARRPIPRGASSLPVRVHRDESRAPSGRAERRRRKRRASRNAEARTKRHRQRRLRRWRRRTASVLALCRGARGATFQRSARRLRSIRRPCRDREEIGRWQAAGSSAPGRRLRSKANRQESRPLTSACGRCDRQSHRKLVRRSPTRPA